MADHLEQPATCAQRDVAPGLKRLDWSSECWALLVRCNGTSPTATLLNQDVRESRTRVVECRSVGRSRRRRCLLIGAQLRSVSTASAAP